MDPSEISRRPEGDVEDEDATPSTVNDDVVVVLSSSLSRRCLSICSISDGESGANTADVTTALCAIQTDINT